MNPIVRLPELTVLSIPPDPYRFDTPAGHRDAQWFAQGVSRFISDYNAVHFRRPIET